MALPASGAISAAMVNQELGRASTASLHLNDTQVRTLAGRPSGLIGYSDLRGKAWEIAVTLSSGVYDRMDMLFTAAVWASDTPKRIIIPAGVHIGDGAGRSYALATTSGAGGQAGSFGGTLVLENRGTISGRGGAANSGAGGDALLTNFLGRNGQRLVIENYGTIRGGGGGGGRGGDGGGGSYQTSYNFREPSSGWSYREGWSVQWYWYVNGPQSQIYWNGTLIWSGSISNTATSHTVGGWTYLKGSSQRREDGGQYYSIARQQTRYDTHNTNGGAGGNGGRGQGYDAGNAAGAGGGAPGTNAGWGGTGGTGGTYGNWGNTGATGGNGNRTSGLGGAGGGAPGWVVTNAATVTWAVTGTRQGRL